MPYAIKNPTMAPSILKTIETLIFSKAVPSDAKMNNKLSM